MTDKYTLKLGYILITIKECGLILVSVADLFPHIQNWKILVVRKWPLNIIIYEQEILSNNNSTITPVWFLKMSLS